MASALKRRLCLGVVGLFGPCLAPCLAAGQGLAEGPMSGPSLVALAAPACDGDPYDRGRLVELLYVELTSLGPIHVVEPPAADAVLASSRVARVELSPEGCLASDTDVVVTVVDGRNGVTTRRVMPLGDVSLAERPRALAIGITELLGPIWTARQTESISTSARTLPVPAPASPPVEPPPTVAAPPDRPGEKADRTTRGPAELAAVLSAELVTFPEHSTTLLGAALEGRLRLLSPLVLRVGGAFGLGSSEVSTGTVRAHAGTASVGLFAAAGQEVEVEIGPRVQAGYAWATGASDLATVKASTYGNVLVLASVGAGVLVRASLGVSLLLGVEAGQALAGVTFLSDGERVAGVSGVALGARAGACLELW